MAASDPQRESPDSGHAGQPSHGPSGAAGVEPLGGADAVPATPDTTPVDHGAEPLARPDVTGPANDDGAAPAVTAPGTRAWPAIIGLVVCVAAGTWVIVANASGWLLVIFAVLALVALVDLAIVVRRGRRATTA